MSNAPMDFKRLAQALLLNSESLLQSWFPEGRIKGREFEVGDITGAKGDSLKINLDKGVWKDFAGTISGGDLISLFAAKNNIGNGEAYRILIGEQGYEPSERPEVPPAQAPEPEVCLPPENVVDCSFIHPFHGESVAHWAYRTPEGAVIFHVARYEDSGGKKILPWSWSVDRKWICKAQPCPRPLYGLEHMANYSKKKLCLIVEGEKSAESARKLLGSKYLVVTWSNGSRAFSKANWSPIYGWIVLIWPDRDSVGKEAARGIAEILKGHCPLIRMLNPGDEEDGWDAADALEEGYEEETIILWAKERVETVWDVLPKPLPVPKPAIVPELVEVIPSKPDPVPVIAKTALIDSNAQVIAGNEIVQEEPAQEHVKVMPPPEKPTMIEIHTGEEAQLDRDAEYWKEKLGLALTTRRQIILDVNCAIRALTNYPEWKNMFWFDEFQLKIFTTWNLKPGDKFREWRDIDTIYLQDFMQDTFGMRKLGKEMLWDALHAVAQRRTRNGPKEYFESLEWDGESRIDKFLTTHMSVDSGKYSEAVSKNFWIMMVARVCRPGCKVDNMMMLEGSQGKYKSTALRIIGGEWFAEAHGQVTDSNFYYNIQGIMLMEFPDLGGISKADANALKKFITCESDRYRAVWARSAADFPRQCVFVGSTNEDEYLKDDTGARRFWPVRTHNIYLDKIRADRDQLFAEAIHCYKSGGKWWEMPAVEAQEEQEKRRLSDVWESDAADFLVLRDEVTVKEIAVEALKIDIAKLDSGLQRRIGRILRLLRWNKRFKRVNGHVVNVWYREPAKGDGDV